MPLMRLPKLAPFLVLLAALIGAASGGLAAAGEDPVERLRGLLEAVKEADARQRVRLLEAALEELDGLEEPPGDLDRPTLEAALARARTAPVLVLDCARAEDQACLLDRARALIDEHRLDDLRPDLGREQARVDRDAAEATAAALDRAGDRLGGSEVVSAIAAQLLAEGRRQDARGLVRNRLEGLLEPPPAAAIHRLVSFGANLSGDGAVDLAAPVFEAAERAAARAIEAVPPSAADEAILVMYRAQALAGLGHAERAIASMDKLSEGPLTTGWIALAALLAKLGEPSAVERIGARFEDDWRINTAQVEAHARAGNYRSAVALAQAAARPSNRWLRLRVAAQAMAARGDAAPAVRVLGALEPAAAPAQLLGLGALWRKIGRAQEAARLRERFLEALSATAPERLQQPVASVEEAEAVAGWILELSRTLPVG